MTPDHLPVISQRGAQQLVLSTLLVIDPGHWNEAASRQAHAAWTPTGGTVLTVNNNDGTQYASMARVAFAYSVTGEPTTRRATVHLGPRHRDHYPGERVSVLYDPGNPARAALAGENDRSTMSNIALSTAVWTSWNGLGLGLFYWYRGRRLRRKLAGNNWRPCRYRHTTIPGRTGKRTRHILTLEPEIAGPWKPQHREVSPMPRPPATPGSQPEPYGSPATPDHRAN